MRQNAGKKIQRIRLPALVIHGEEDNLVPMTEAEAIYGLLETEKVAHYSLSDHNTLFFEGEEEYFEAVRNFIK